MGKPKENNIAGGGIWLLQMVLEPGFGRCVNEEVEHRRGWT